MKKDLKIAIIGAGSSYTPELIDGLIARSSQLPISEVRLVDIDEGWHKAEIILSLTRRMFEHAGLPVKVILTQDRKEA